MTSPYNTSEISKWRRTVYFVRCLGGGPIKIGVSCSPVKRFQVHAGWSPIPLELAAKAPGRMCDENYIHEIFKDFRLHGEWFLPNPKLEALIAQVAATGELPPEFVRELAPRPPGYGLALTKSGKPRKRYERKADPAVMHQRMCEARKRSHARKNIDRQARAAKFQIVWAA